MGFLGLKPEALRGLLGGLSVSFQPFSPRRQHTEVKLLSPAQQMNKASSCMMLGSLSLLLHWSGSWTLLSNPALFSSGWGLLEGISKGLRSTSHHRPRTQLTNRATSIEMNACFLGC